ncbi:NAD-dependent protein deacetylase sirtuin-2 [Eurytemora carolleeae]|uniref:NAD-dependent protein deacetylase sirtuin-2 n=1 Tax=Eurytemora carolleeae TaxID=1294199 RepID=UPI000C75AD0F|nr:NAD-dependent protein deacetylase sirtuin-2 [Eurytemora carolleeae]|eukprot:XP_023319967.1 NAD-dependent protein deacetylase sirtuin-2-like [Eurytemora affinis]
MEKLNPFDKNAQQNKEEENTSSSDEEEKISGSSSDEDGGEDRPDGFSLDQIRRKYANNQLSVKVVEQLNPHVLDELNLEGVVEYIKQGRANNIIVLVGAGISTGAGIPDFRTPGTGLYSKIANSDSSNSPAGLDIRYFSENPKPMFDLIKELYLDHNPTLTHYFIALLEKKGLLLRVYTQNVDSLELEAGLGKDKLVESHGSINTSHCLQCSKEHSRGWTKERILSDTLPKCNECQGLVKPDVLLFGEDLPEKYFTCLEQDFKICDLLIILGTSLLVQPFCGLIDCVKNTCPRLLINKEKVGIATDLSSILEKKGLQYDSPGNYRDVHVGTDTDTGCKTLSEKLGWNSDLQKLFKSEKK